MSTTEERFPTTIAYSSSGGPQFSTEVTVLNSGHEQRNQNWEQARHRFRVNNVRVGAELDSLQRLFHAVAGKACTFRFKNHKDFKSSDVSADIAFNDQIIAAGDGVTVSFQTVKNYTSNALTTPHNIVRLAAGTFILGFQDTAATPTWSVQDVGSRWSVVESTGVISISANLSPTITGISNANPAVVTAVGHGLLTDDTTYVDSFTGGTWNTVDDRRYAITRINNDTFSIPVDGTSLGTWASGNMNTIPQVGENLVAGFEFDLLCRFDTDELQATYVDRDIVAVPLTIIEVRA